MAKNDYIITIFIDSLKVEKNLSQNTLSAYKFDIEDFAIFLLKRKPQVNLDGVKESDILDYIKNLHSKKSFSQKTQSRRISSIRSFYLFCYREKIIDTNPAKAIKNPKLQKNLPKFLTLNEVQKLLEVSKTDKNPMFYTMLEVLYATGMRVSELVSLKLSALIENNSFLLITGKGDKERIVPLTNIASKYLVQWREIRHNYYKLDDNNSKYFFPSMNAKEGHITRERFAQLLKTYAINCGIDYEKVSPHIIRHSFASHLLNNGGDLKAIQSMLGHADISTTEIYTHIADENLQNAIYENHPLANKINK